MYGMQVVEVLVPSPSLDISSSVILEAKHFGDVVILINVVDNQALVPSPNLDNNCTGRFGEVSGYVGDDGAAV